MKKNYSLIILILIFIFLCTVGVVSCNHTHTYSEDWTSDETYHWHKATCEHSKEISGKEEHNFGEWEVVTAPRKEIDGLEKRVCRECEYEENRIIHIFSDKWTGDETYHWHKAICEHTDVIGGNAEHCFDNNGNCICGMTYGTTGLTYILSDDKESYDVAGIGSVTDTDIVIGSLYNGKIVRNIRERAFIGCSNLKSVTISNSIAIIENAAFRGCSNLTNVTISNSVTWIDENAFRECSSLTSLTLPDNVVSIGWGAFYGCSNLTSITIPNSVKSIGFFAFDNCNELKRIYYKGSADEWSKIRIDEGDNSSLIDVTYYYSETEPTDTDNKYWRYAEDGVTVVEW